MAHRRFSPSEELGQIDRNIIECERRISEQKHRIGLLTHTANDKGEAAKLYENLLDSLSVLRELRELVKREVEEMQR